MTDSRDEHEPYGFTESPVIAKLQDEIARLTAERDEARRMVCGLDADIMEDQIEYAKHRGWDCFKEETGGTQKTRDAGIG
jgi:hypothetical protein